VKGLVAFKGAAIYPVDAPKMESGTILVADGKVKALGGGESEIPTGAEVVDLTGKVILPGFIDAHSHLGIMGEGEGQSSNDANEMPDPVNGKISSLYSANPAHRSFASAREGGITTVNIVPLGNPIAGLSFACKTVGSIIDDMVVRDPTGLKCALGEGPKRAHGLNRKQAPTTRMGIAGLVREFFYKAREYKEKKEAAKAVAGLATDDASEARGEGDGKMPDIDLNLEAGVRVLRGELPFRIHAHRYDDIVTAIRICEEFGISYSIEHCTAGHLIVDFLAEREITAHVGPGLMSRGPQERAEADDRNPAILDAAGVKVCLITDHPFLDSRYMLPYAAVVHKHGMPLDRVLRALTLNPAESLGIDDRVGSLTPGKDADFLVLSGEPFTYTSVILSTYIEGEEVYSRPTY